MQKKQKIFIATSILFMTFISMGFAEPLTALMCKEKAKAAAALIQAEGESAFAKLKNPNGEFIFGDGVGYVWVHNIDGVMLMHPIKPAIEGVYLMDKRDANGFYLYVAMNELAEDHGEGWLQYAWPKVGAKASSPKVSYVVLVKDYIVGSGIYDVTIEDIKKQFPGDAVYEE